MNKEIIKQLPDGYRLAAAYPRLALSIIDRVAGRGPASVLGELGISEGLWNSEFVPFEDHLKIIALGRSLIPDFSARMAAKCGINTLGPMQPAILSARCGREAWVIASIYIPILDNTSDISFEGTAEGCSLILRRTVEMNDADEVDFCMAGANIAGSILAAGLSSSGFPLYCTYYNMGPLPETTAWGTHVAAQDGGGKRLVVHVDAATADTHWFTSTEANMRSELDKLDDLLDALNKRPGVYRKLDKALSSCEVRVGKPMPCIEEICDYMHMSKASINNRLKRSQTTVDKMRRQWAIKHAITLGRETDLPWDVINDLTTQVSTVSNMNKQIKGVTGMTLTEIREQA